MLNSEYNINKIKIYMFIGIFLFGFMLMTFMHEKVHEIIFEDYGIKSHIEWISHFPDVVTMPEENYELCSESYILAHNINEAISYPLFSFYILIGFGILFLIDKN